MLNRIRTFARSHKALSIAALVLIVLIAATLIFHPHGTQTYLILGIDNYGLVSQSGRSDVMMLVQIDFDRRNISTVTFARDMLIPDHKGNMVKINTIVRSESGGEDGLVSALENAFGIEIDGWFRVNFTSVILLVDAIGGVEIELTADEVRYLNNHAGIYPDYPLSEGKSRLNGGQALSYARCRALDNDMGRGQRQNKLMRAMVSSAGKMSIGRIGGVFNSLSGAWTSSLSGAQQAGLLSKVIWLRGASVTSIGVPFEGTYRYGSSGGTNGVVANIDSNRTLLRQALGLDPISDE